MGAIVHGLHTVHRNDVFYYGDRVFRFECLPGTIRRAFVFRFANEGEAVYSIGISRWHFRFCDLSSVLCLMSGLRGLPVLFLHGCRQTYPLGTALLSVFWHEDSCIFAAVFGFV